MMQKNKDPFVRIVKRNDISSKKKWHICGVTVIAVLVISLLFLFVISGKNPFVSFEKIIGGTFNFNASSLKKFFKTSTMQEIVMMFMIALALIPAYKMKFWNVGAQGQILMGALMCAVIMNYCSALPSWLVIVLCLAGAVIGGGIWGVIPALFKAKWNTNETLFTLMMNYVAIKLVGFATENWRGDKSSMGTINLSTEVGWLPTIGGITWLLPLIIVLLLMVGMYFYMKTSKHGYEIRVVGESTETARYAGINVKMVIVRTLALSGALCGLVGFFYVCGFSHTISASTGGNNGFTAIIACWLGNFNPFAVGGFSFLIVFLNKGATNLQDANIASTLNEYSCELIFLVVIVSIMVIHFFMEYKLSFRKKELAMVEMPTSDESTSIEKAEADTETLEAETSIEEKEELTENRVKEDETV